MSPRCCFCNELQGHGNEFQQLYPALRSRVLHATEHFVIMPSLGQLAPGHLLVLPRRHFTSFGELPGTFQEEEARMLYSLIRSTADQVVSFEHGSPPGATAGGCGIVHAHLHVVPVGRPINELPPSVGSGWGRSTSSTWLDVAAEITQTDSGYLMWHGSSNPPEIERVTAVPSQHLRRHLAGLIGTAQWDWRKAGAQAELAKLVREARAQPLQYA